jgi:hypothetical protein
MRDRRVRGGRIEVAVRVGLCRNGKWCPPDRACAVRCGYPLSCRKPDRSQRRRAPRRSARVRGGGTQTLPLLPKTTTRGVTLWSLTQCQGQAPTRSTTAGAPRRWPRDASANAWCHSAFGGSGAMKPPAMHGLTGSGAETAALPRHYAVGQELDAVWSSAIPGCLLPSRRSPRRRTSRRSAFV